MNQKMELIIGSWGNFTDECIKNGDIWNSSIWTFLTDKTDKENLIQKVSYGTPFIEEVEFSSGMGKNKVFITFKESE